MPNLITGPGQIEWNGLLLGDGTEYLVQSLTGWRELPGVDVGTENRPMVHGAWAGRVLAQERIVTAELTIVPLDGEVGRVVAELEAATSPSEDAAEAELTVEDYPGERRSVWGQITRRAIPLASGYRQRITGVAIQWNCADPRLYAPVDREVSTGLPSSGGGLDYPLSYPLSYGAPGASGAVPAENAGNVPTSPRLTVTGSCVRPQVVNQTTGKTLDFDLVLGPGERLEIDCRNGTALLNGTGDRLYAITGESVPVEDFDLVPGPNTVAFRAAQPDPAATLAVRWRDAWL
ncbi:phage distal tail protein [Actinomadura yumaensis]|uniref:Phage tail domain-containing protein n=1 Tax=Actinomadura yumaensis TaxID=111807 RepID=A0ABW2CT91_9ACTN